MRTCGIAGLNLWYCRCHRRGGVYPRPNPAKQMSIPHDKILPPRGLGRG